MATNKLTAQPRSETGTSAAKRLRREGKIPAVIYGDGSAEPITIDARGFRAALHDHGGSGILSLTVDGEAVTALVKEIQRDSTRDEITHVDLQKIKLDEKIHTTVPVRLAGEAPGVKMGGVLQHALWELEVQATARTMPDAIELDISTLEIGDSLHVAAIAPPEGVEFLTNPDTIVVSVLAPQIIREEVVEVAAEEEGAAPGEGAPAEGAPAAEE